MNKIILIFITLILLSGANFAATQTGAVNRPADEKILVASAQPLTQKMMDDLIEYFEWSLNAQIGGGQRMRIQQIVVDEWRTGTKETAKNFALIFDKVQRFKSLTPKRRDEVQPKQQKSFLEYISREPRSELDQILYTAYDQARQNERAESNAATDKDSQKNKTGANTKMSGDLSGLIGEWSTGDQAFSLLGSSAGNVFANAGGSIRSFRISQDGRVEFATFFTQSLSNCVTKIFRTSEGKVSVNGDKITFDFAPGKVQSQSGCDRQRNYTKPVEAERQIFTYTIEPFNDGQKMCLLDADNANYCVYKK